MVQIPDGAFFCCHFHFVSAIYLVTSIWYSEYLVKLCTMMIEVSSELEKSVLYAYRVLLLLLLLPLLCVAILLLLLE